MFHALTETLNLLPATGVPETDGLVPEGAKISETTLEDGDALGEGTGRIVTYEMGLFKKLTAPAAFLIWYELKAQIILNSEFAGLFQVAKSGKNCVEFCGVDSFRTEAITVPLSAVPHGALTCCPASK